MEYGDKIQANEYDIQWLNGSFFSVVSEGKPE